MTFEDHLRDRFTVDAIASLPTKEPRTVQTIRVADDLFEAPEPEDAIEADTYDTDEIRIVDNYTVRVVRYADETYYGIIGGPHLNVLCPSGYMLHTLSAVAEGGPVEAARCTCGNPEAIEAFFEPGHDEIPTVEAWVAEQRGRLVAHHNRQARRLLRIAVDYSIDEPAGWPALGEPDADSEHPFTFEVNDEGTIATGTLVTGMDWLSLHYSQVVATRALSPDETALVRAARGQAATEDDEDHDFDDEFDEDEEDEDE